LTPGAAVTTSRAHVHYVVTEYGIAALHGRDLAERARSLIGIAAPQFREQLERAALALHLM
jgi:4-hydroxybutyrate CoA-transferase